jgi:hypothetical protein
LNQATQVGNCIKVKGNNGNVFFILAGEWKLLACAEKIRTCGECIFIFVAEGQRGAKKKQEEIIHNRREGNRKR